MKPIPTEHIDQFGENFEFLLFRRAMLAAIDEAELAAWIAEFEENCKP